MRRDRWLVWFPGSYADIDLHLQHLFGKVTGLFGMDQTRAADSARLVIRHLRHDHVNPRMLKQSASDFGEPIKVTPGGISLNFIPMELVSSPTAPLFHSMTRPHVSLTAMRFSQSEQPVTSANSFSGRRT